MVPERISLAGFLCYRDVQEARFDGRSLWMLAGPNGSGKSSLFDAVTFALYGRHRGGKQNAEALINRRGDGLVVEFDFRIDGCLYRARRTLRRGQPMTRQMLQRLPNSDAGRWEEIAGTDRDDGFKRWVRDHIGLSEQTFLASVMLRQGEADRLLLADPSERHRFLGEIVGLDVYQRLHERAKEQHAAAKATADELSRRLADVPEIAADHVQQAEQTAADAAHVAEDAAGRVQILSEQRLHARHWQELDARQRSLSRRCAELQQIVKDRAAIESQQAEFERLDRHLPRLEECVRWQADARAARQRLDQLRHEDETLAGQHQRLHAGTAATAAAIARRQQDAERLTALVQQAQRESNELVAVLPRLEALHEHRQVWQAGRREQTEADAALAALQAERAALLGHVPTDADLTDADQQWHRAQTRLGEAAARCHDAEQRWERFHSVTEERACRYCGQELPAEHVETEAARLHHERDDARRLCRDARQEHAAAQGRRQQLQTRRQETERALRVTEQCVHQCEVARQTAEHRQQDSARAGQHARAALPAALRERAADAAGGDFPSADDLHQYRQRSAALDESLARLDAERTDARADIERLESEQSLHQSARDTLDRQRQHLAQQIVEQEARRAHLRESITSALAALPEPWTAWSDDVAAAQAVPLRERCESLRAADITGRFARLCQAQADGAALAPLLDDLQRQIAAVPEPARRDPAAVEHDLQSARRAHHEQQQTAADAARRLDQLLRQRRERDDLGRRFRESDRRRHLWHALTQHLGPRGLQRDLVRRAERQIVELANALLDRLSAGTLHIELAPEPDDAAPRALDLRARTAASPDPLDAALLSGSQRFRVAVALSLAIGQHAAPARRPVRAVIIDEGFGCLDADNRQVMIQELHNLRHGGLDRILLVSHQEEFTQAFPDGYLCQPTEDGTKLVPFHR